MRFATRLAPLLGLLATACAEAPTDASESLAAGVGPEADRVAVSDQPEVTAPAAVGYLAIDGEWVCSATLISERVAVTAAHCTGWAGDYAFGLGHVSAGRRIEVASVVAHPSYEGPDLAAAHDVALLLLAEPVALPDGAEPARVAAAAPGCGARYVDGDPTVRSGVASACIDRVEGGEVHLERQDGDDCMADNGGPLLVDDAGALVGVASRVVVASADDALCARGYSVVYQSLEPVADWIEGHLGCSPGAQAACGTCGTMTCGADGTWGGCAADAAADACSDGYSCSAAGFCE